MKKIWLLLLGLLTSLAFASDFNLGEIQTQQLVMVITDNADAIQGQLSTYEKDNLGKWQRHRLANQVVIGRTGLAWGKGLHPQQQGQQKKEGDGKAPAGIFRLGEAFGYLDKINTSLNYSPMSANDFCIDVNGSPLYNQIVSTAKVGKAAIKGSSEPMRRDIHKQDHLYKKGIVIAHNPNNISGEGSCIFMHLWRANNKPTAGCTAMAEPEFDALLAWLNTSKRPILVALTKADYQRLQTKWQLPLL